MDLLAHSASHYGKEHPYADHIKGCLKIALRKLEELQPFISPARFIQMKTRLIQVMELHDLGKLDIEDQIALHDKNWQGCLPIPHQYAGAWYFYHYLNDVFSAALVQGHHRPGLPNLNGEIASDAPFCGSYEENIEKIQQRKNHIEQHMDEYLERHVTAIGRQMNFVSIEGNPTQLEERILLSCVVEADWTDSGARNRKKVQSRWEERLEKLDQFIVKLKNDVENKKTEQSEERNRIRNMVYEECRNEAAVSAGMLSCEACVGTGKTTAILAYLLRCAKERELRHIFIVLPYTSIFQQMQAVLKEAVVFDEENEEEVITVIHHKVEYTSAEMKRLADTYSTPIILITAVQFYESIASNKPSRLRKLYQLPGSALFLDEFHTSIPLNCQPIVWNWLTELNNDWGCITVLSSGTMNRFWKNYSFQKAYGKKHIVQEPKALLGHELQEIIEHREQQRVKKHIAPIKHQSCNFKTVNELLDFALSKPGPRLLMMDTRKAAAVAAHELKKRGKAVVHLSNAFIPSDCDEILKQVIERLESEHSDDASEDWTLVTTVYAALGLNLSFRNGFCRAFSCDIFLQFLGRINRNNEFPDAGAWVFETADERIPPNKGMELSREVWKDMLNNGIDGQLLCEFSPSELATYAFREENKFIFNATTEQSRLISLERKYQFADVAKLFKIIPEEDEVLAVVDKAVVDCIREGRRFSYTDIQKGSVSIYRSLVQELYLEEIAAGSGIYSLPEEKYDAELLGCFKIVVE